MTTAGVQLKKIIVAGLVSLLAGCSEPDLIVHGDSTAIASRGGLLKIFDLAPQWDQKRWWNIVAASSPARSVVNFGMGGQSIAQMRDEILSEEEHRGLPTIIYDLRNHNEDPARYVEILKEAIDALRTEKFLILPQVPRSRGFPETESHSAAIAFIDQRVMEQWPSNTFSNDERQRFLAELSADDTRFDGLHRNDKGQDIEARFIGAWLHSRRWGSPGSQPTQSSSR